MRKALTALGTLTIALTPMVAYAATGQPIRLHDIELLIGDIVSFLITIASLAVVGAFIWAGFLYLTDGGSGAKVKTAKAVFKNAAIGALIIFGVGVIVATITTFAQRPADIIR